MFFSFFFSISSPPQNSFWDAHPPLETVNARPVRILLECILVFVCLQASVLTPSGASGCSAGSAPDGRAGCTLIGQNYKAASMRSWTSGRGRTDTGGIGNAFLYVVPTQATHPSSHPPRDHSLPNHPD